MVTELDVKGPPLYSKTEIEITLPVHKQKLIELAVKQLDCTKKRVFQKVQALDDYLFLGLFCKLCKNKTQGYICSNIILFIY